MAKDCNGCGNDFVCNVCGKKYVSEKYYLLHIEKCKIKEENIPTITEEEIFETEIEEVNIPTITEEEIFETEIEEVITEEENCKIELVTFFNNLGGRRAASRSELMRMFNWFGILYPRAQLSFDPSCPQCCTHCYNKLNQVYNQIKDVYIKKIIK